MKLYAVTFIGPPLKARKLVNIFHGDKKIHVRLSYRSINPQFER